MILHKNHKESVPATFADLRLAEPILRAVVSEGYSVPTPIQAKAIPHILEGHDLLGCAQTGTGKTAAFALPILHLLTARPPGTPTAQSHTAAAGTSSGHVPHPLEGERSPRTGQVQNPFTSRREGGGNAYGPGRKARALILSPTRELAVQIGESFHVYGANTGLRHTVVFGGVGYKPQIDALRRGLDIIVATPGRLMDLMQQRHVDLSGIEIFVLDEADRMLDMGFIQPIRLIVSKIPGKRQTLMFSATMPKEIRRLADSILRNPVSVEVAPVAATADLVEQSVYFVDRRAKINLLKDLVQGSPASDLTLVFTRTKHGADRVVKELHGVGIRSEAIHGNKRQNVRQRALEKFRTGHTPVLVATDIAARGIDIDNIALVVNFDLPNVPETYVHRIGRTGRAGASGRAVSFCDYEERPWLRDIERLIRKQVPVAADQPGKNGVRPAHAATGTNGAAHAPRPAHVSHSSAPAHAPSHSTSHSKPHAPHKAAHSQHAPARDGNGHDGNGHDGNQPFRRVPANSVAHKPEPKHSARAPHAAHESDFEHAPEVESKPAHSSTSGPRTPHVPHKDPPRGEGHAQFRHQTYKSENQQPGTGKQPEHRAGPGGQRSGGHPGQRASGGQYGKPAGKPYRGPAANPKSGGYSSGGGGGSAGHGGSGGGGGARPPRGPGPSTGGGYAATGSPGGNKRGKGWKGPGRAIKRSGPKAR